MRFGVSVHRDTQHPASHHLDKPSVVDLESLTEGTEVSRYLNSFKLTQRSRIFVDTTTEPNFTAHTRQPRHTTPHHKRPSHASVHKSVHNPQHTEWPEPGLWAKDVAAGCSRRPRQRWRYRDSNTGPLGRRPWITPDDSSLVETILVRLDAAMHA